jgi:uncharacterized membrane protein YidH (DUF202 family)
VRSLAKAIVVILIVSAGVISAMAIFIWVPAFRLFEGCTDYPVNHAPKSCQFLALPLTVIAIALPLVVIVDVAIGWKRVFSRVN